MNRLLTIALVLLLLIAVMGAHAWVVGEVIPVDFQMRSRRGATAVARDDVDDYEDAALMNAKLYERPLQPDYCPRFGVNKRVHLPAQQLFTMAEKSIADGGIVSGVALRFSMGRGLGKSTAWIPLMQNAFDKKQREKSTTHFLTSIRFDFGYQQGTFNKLTSFRAEPLYSTKRHDDIELTFHWDENRAYNPHRALSVCAFVAVLTSIIVLQLILFGKDGFTKYFRSNRIVVRSHKE